MQSMMSIPKQWTPQPDLVLIEPWDEEGETLSGIWLDHSWEPQAGHAFGLVLAKADRCTTLNQQAMMDELSIGNLVLFTRSAYIKVPYEGQTLLFVNVEDIQSVLVMEEGDYERYGAARVDA